MWMQAAIALMVLFWLRSCENSPTNRMTKLLNQKDSQEALLILKNIERILCF